jgi:DNA-binding transcriptional regulator YdaS (Cro superfamily)
VLFPSASMPTKNEISSAISELPRGECSAIARELGVSPTAVSQWKKGNQFPPYETALLLIEALRERGVLE